jgi:hypothetical protein
VDIIGEVNINVSPDNVGLISKIYNKITLVAEPVDRNVVYNITNNPNDIIRDIAQTFPFTIMMT